jgi:hypothetical protein
MKTYQIAVLIFLFQGIAFAQTGKINSTYAWNLTEFLTISEDNFKSYFYPTYPLLCGLNIWKLCLQRELLATKPAILLN